MSASITGSSNPSPSFSYTPSAGFLAAQQLQITKTVQANFRASGVLLDQCDTLYANTLTFTASTPQTLDLTSLTDILGNSISFARVRYLLIRINSTTDGQVLLCGNSVTNEWDAFVSAAGTFTVYPSTANNAGFTVFCAPNSTGAPVTSSHKTLKLDPGSNAFTVDVMIAGCSS